MKLGACSECNEGACPECNEGACPECNEGMKRGTDAVIKKAMGAPTARPLRTIHLKREKCRPQHRHVSGVTLLDKEPSIY